MHDYIDEHAMHALGGFDDAIAQSFALLTLSNAVASVLGVRPKCVVESLWWLPINLVSLLNSPQGWGIIASCVAQNSGVHDCTYSPTVH